MLNEEILNKLLKKEFNKDLDSATNEEIHDVLASLVSEEVVSKSNETIANNRGKKAVNYVSI